MRSFDVQSEINILQQENGEVKSSLVKTSNDNQTLCATVSALQKQVDTLASKSIEAQSESPELRVLLTEHARTFACCKRLVISGGVKPMSCAMTTLGSVKR